MTISQKDRLSITGAVADLSAGSAALVLGFALAGAPVGLFGTVALIGCVSGGLILSGVVDLRKENPNTRFDNYDSNLHSGFTNGLYNFFSSIAKTAGLHKASAYANTSKSPSNGG